MIRHSLVHCLNGNRTEVKMVLRIPSPRPRQVDWPGGLETTGERPMRNPTRVSAPAVQASMLEGFVKLGREYRAVNGLKQAFDDDVRGVFLNSLSRAYWQPTRDFMANNNWPVAKACKAAGVNPSTCHRWNTGETVPNYATVCLLFAQCDLDMRGVRFPTGQEALRLAFFKTLDHIRLGLATPSFLEVIRAGGRPASDDLRSRREELARSKDLVEFDEEAWECLRLVLRNDAVLKAVQAAEHADGDPHGAAEAMRQAAESIASEMTTRYPAGRIRDASGVQRTVSEWLIPWVLFYTVIPPAQRGD
jgi:hypothetical protein